MYKRNKAWGMAAAGAAAALMGSALAHPGHDRLPGAPNGYGADPDGDSNPAVNTQLIARIGAAAEAALDPPFKIVTFEDGRHGKTIRKQKVNSRTVKFSEGLSRQLCDGQLYFRYDTECTYMAAPSGKFAAAYRDEHGRALRIEFEEPVCAAALAVYPVGGREGEFFNINLQPYDHDGEKLDPIDYQFAWTQDTFRWRLMAGAFFLNERASRVDVNVTSEDNPTRYQRFLIDDVAFVENDCELALEDINAEDGITRDVDLAIDVPAFAPGTDDSGL